jgi:hypothetical protein
MSHELKLTRTAIKSIPVDPMIEQQQARHGRTGSYRHQHSDQ